MRQFINNRDMIEEKFFIDILNTNGGQYRIDIETVVESEKDLDNIPGELPCGSSGRCLFYTYLDVDDEAYSNEYSRVQAGIETDYWDEDESSEDEFLSIIFKTFPFGNIKLFDAKEMMFKWIYFQEQKAHTKIFFPVTKMVVEDGAFSKHPGDIKRVINEDNGDQIDTFQKKSIGRMLTQLEEEWPCVYVDNDSNIVVSRYK